MSKANRAETIRRFSPYYNNSSTPEIAKRGKPEIRVLGDATCIISGTKVGQTEPAYPYLDRQSPADSELDD